VSGPEGRAVEGLAHLQVAAVELIAAARAFLDVAEDVVRDPGAAASVVDTLGALAAMARAEWPVGRAAGHSAPAADPPGAGGEAADDLPRVRWIPLADDA
jgi:hypothetical protein